MATDRGVKKTVALIRNATQITRNKEDWHPQLFADGKQTITRNIDAGILHINGRLLPAEGCAGSNGHRFLLARSGDQFHLWIISNQRNDLAQASLGQIGNKINSRVFEALHQTSCELVFHLEPSRRYCPRMPASLSSRSSLAISSLGICSVSHLGNRFTPKPRMRKTSCNGTRPYLRSRAATRRAAVSTLFCASTARA